MLHGLKGAYLFAFQRRVGFSLLGLANNTELLYFGGLRMDWQIAQRIIGTAEEIHSVGTGRNATLYD